MPTRTSPCPECGTDARQIPTETVRNVVEPFGNQNIEDGVQYRICEGRDCPIVYFADDLDQRFETDVIHVPVNVKLDPDAGSYPLCYCFGYEKAHVREEVAENGETNIAEWITERVRAEECACRWKSPLGGCCLATVRRAIDEVETEVGDR